MDKPVQTTPTAVPPPSKGWFGLAYLLIFVAGVGFFLLSFIALGVMPGLRLSKNIAAHSMADMPAYTPAELRGRQLYARLGCALCHTQQIRYILPDVLRWGPPTEAWETRYDYPQLWGTRRIGPDLSRETGIRSDDWQLTHLFSPQWVVPNSVMPDFKWLFHGSPDKPTTDATDLVAYLKTLGRARQSGAGQIIGTPPKTDLDTQMEKDIASLCATPFINPHQALTGGTTPNLALYDAHRQLDRGATLFNQNCAGCHGSAGDGNTLAATGLSPKPSDLRLHKFSSLGLAHILWNGRPGSAMPAWRDLPPNDLAQLVNYVQTLHTTPAVASSPPPATELARGAVLFATNCVSCHGVEGRGDGPVGALLLPRPADFTNIRPDTKQTLEVLNKGVPGTSMPPWPSLNAADKQALSLFVSSLFQPAVSKQP